MKKVNGSPHKKREETHLRCVDAKEANQLIAEAHSGECGAHMNGFIIHGHRISRYIIVGMPQNIRIIKNPNGKKDSSDDGHPMDYII